MRVINIEGIDAVGKETVSKALEERLSEKGYRVKRISFPNYDGSIGKSIKEILMGACGSAPSLDPDLMGPFYTMDRLSYFKCNIDDLIDNYDYVIMDRSFYSNLMYQAAKFYISGKNKPIQISDDITKYGMNSSTLTTVFDWISRNYQWEIQETGLYRCDNMFTFVLSMDEESSKKQLSNRKEVDTNETSRSYLEECKEFITKILSNDYRYNIMKFIDEYAFAVRLCNRSRYIQQYMHNAAFYYLSNVDSIEVKHVENPKDIPSATNEVVNKILDMMYDNDMFDDDYEGDDANGEN